MNSLQPSRAYTTHAHTHYTSALHGTPDNAWRLREKFAADGISSRWIRGEPRKTDDPGKRAASQCFAYIPNRYSEPYNVQGETERKRARGRKSITEQRRRPTPRE